MKMLPVLIASTFLTSAQLAKGADEDFSKEVIKATVLSPSVALLEGAGGNMTALIGREGVLLIDDDFAPMAEKLIAKLKELKGDQPRFIINTHFHYDHTGSNEVFGPSSTIIAATAVRTRLMSSQILWKKQHPAAPRQAWPLITFDHSIDLHLNDEDVRVVHYPRGHTDGDSVVFLKNQKVVCMGDLYFSGMYPIFHPEHGGSLRGLVKTLESVLRESPEDAKFVPGHGPVTAKIALRQYHKMILASIATVKKGLKEGRTLEQIQKSGLAREWEPFSHGYLTTARWIQLLYENLKNEN